MPDQPRLIAEDSAPYRTAQDNAERQAYRERLRAWLQYPASRQIEGFPIASDEAILALSDPPFYTACPNPFLPEIIERCQQERETLRAELGLTDPHSLTPSPQGEAGASGETGAGSNGYHREPFAADVSEGKNDSIYNAHSYHTKVPHKAVMRDILHYTEPGDIVFDGFCGTGMTGVAAQLCGDKKAVESLGYYVDDEGWIWERHPGGQVSKVSGVDVSTTSSGTSDTRHPTPISRLGVRKAVLVDLSPAATFIAYNYNTPVDVEQFEREVQRILAEVEAECGWMYETWHPHCDDPHRVKGRINYTVWSDVLVCPNCGGEMVFWDVAVDEEKEDVKDLFTCPQCHAELMKENVERASYTTLDKTSQQTVQRAKN